MTARKHRGQGGYRPYGTEVKSRPATDKRAALWLAMRVLLRFDLAHLVTTTEATRTNCQDYLTRLCRAGFVRLVSKGNGPARRMAMYHLVRNSGPRAPITRRSGDVYDPNTDTIYTAAGAVKAKGERDDDASP